MSTLGEKITAARKRKAMTQVELGVIVGLANASISAYENDGLKGTPDSTTLIRISEALQAPEILIHHCDSCPVRQHIMLKLFPDLDRIKRDPLAVATRLRKEMMEGAQALENLIERFGDVDPKSRPDYQELFEREMEQVIDVKRGIEILEFELLLSGLHTREDLDRVYDHQQAKCIEHGHHVPQEAAQL